MMADGVSSFKMYLTYDYKLEDADTLKVLKKLKDIGGITTVHCENDAIIHYLRDKFVAEGNRRQNITHSPDRHIVRQRLWTE